MPVRSERRFHFPADGSGHLGVPKFFGNLNRRGFGVAGWLEDRALQDEGGFAQRLDQMEGEWTAREDFLRRIPRGCLFRWRKMDFGLDQLALRVPQPRGAALCDGVEAVVPRPLTNCAKTFQPFLEEVQQRSRMI